MHSDDTTRTGTGGAPAGAPPKLWRLRLLWSGRGGIASGPTTQAPFWDGAQPLLLGRSTGPTTPASPLRIDDDRASREHARLWLHGDDVWVEDLRSKNGSQINGLPLLPGAPQPITDGDILRIGDSFILFRHETANAQDAHVPAVVGVSAASRAIRLAIARVAATPSPVLILGETGTGKDVVASALHEQSKRRGPWLAVNCATIPATLAEAQLFGVRRGAFTGALERGGLFQDADGGTLFLDEIGELPIDLQPKLLRVLESGEFTPVGGGPAIRTKVRVVSATNRDLQAAIAAPGSASTFRSDLYARLAVHVVQLPPLRARREDILPLCIHFAGPDFRPSARVVSALLLHGFPLNIRELRNLLSRWVDTHDEAELLAALPPGPLLAPQRPAAPRSEDPAPSAQVPPQHVPRGPLGPGAAPRWNKGDPVPSRDQIIALLTQHHGRLHAIERAFGVSRRQFRRWAEERYHLDIAQYRDPDPAQAQAQAAAGAPHGADKDDGSDEDTP